jgi:hypothetical protein
MLLVPVAKSRAVVSTLDCWNCRIIQQTLHSNVTTIMLKPRPGSFSNIIPSVSERTVVWVKIFIYLLFGTEKFSGCVY